VGKPAAEGLSALCLSVFVYSICVPVAKLLGLSTGMAETVGGSETVCVCVCVSPLLNQAVQLSQLQVWLHVNVSWLVCSFILTGWCLFRQVAVG